MSTLLTQDFFARDALDVAIDLIGKHLQREDVVLRITEVEAYRHPDDTANHCRMGLTPRNAAMWGPPGHAYVYLCYGIHHLLNLVTDQDGQGAAVLIRACEPVNGQDTLRERRRGIEGPAQLTGPGKIGAALGLDVSWSGHPLFTTGGLSVHDAKAPTGYLRGPRVGIDYADPKHVKAPWRIAAADTPWVSERKSLRPFRR